jgi:RNA polymerase sigma-70 factor (ECF subfamily)
VGLSEAMLATLAAEWPEQAESDPMQEALRRCLEPITPNNRELLRLRYFERRPCHEVAAIMGKKIETVYQALTRIHRALGDCVKHRMAQEASS